MNMVLRPEDPPILKRDFINEFEKLGKSKKR